MCTTNKGTQGDVTQTAAAKFGFALFPHKGANGDVNQIRLIKGKKKKKKIKAATHPRSLHDASCIA